MTCERMIEVVYHLHKSRNRNDREQGDRILEMLEADEIQCT